MPSWPLPQMGLMRSSRPSPASGAEATAHIPSLDTQKAHGVLGLDDKCRYGRLVPVLSQQELEALPLSTARKCPVPGELAVHGRMMKIFERVGNKEGCAAVFHEEHTSGAAMRAVNRARRYVETRRVTLSLQLWQLIEFIPGCIFGPYGIIGFGVHAGTVNGVALCRMFHRAIRWQPWMPKYLSDHDPFFRFGQWQANVRVLEVTEIKTVAYVPLSHPLVERLIGTVRREYLDRILFWAMADLETKMIDFSTLL
jgi:hypothetical protein